MSKSADFLPACENDPTGLLQALHPLRRLLLRYAQTPPALRLEPIVEATEYLCLPDPDPDAFSDNCATRDAWRDLFQVDAQPHPRRMVLRLSEAAPWPAGSSAPSPTASSNAMGRAAKASIPVLVAKTRRDW